ncbi:MULTISPECIES: serine/threonine-protein kinase [Streptomyces]|uniref:serine/threonine-protein kinase n=1 Tax=Streptomyces TaxID=1883 RepID=UPI0013187801|nr:MULTISPECIES: serine/threonine-protein kinase [Streptomyces]QGZ47414.1 tetratricopeptide repeat protein [Streptomyces sp. QHH-9511]GGT79568.1 serine/threonine protein kinase [Streptomyces lateritius]
MAETRLVQGRYRLHDVIGRGGMGEVWRATDESLGRRVAVKCLKPLGPQQDPNFMKVLRERFRREARVAASLQHRGVTVVHDFGESDGVLFLVMELLEGHNLSQLLDENKQHPLPVQDVVDIAEQVADALAYTHRQGIVHRDLKPANIMRLGDGAVKICDFGIARLGADIGFTSRLTGTGIAMGTPHYMSPEQISGGEIDHRSDLYSLGCVLYEIATGAPPFDLDDAWAVLVGHRDTPPEPLRTRRAELPDYLDRIVLDLLAKTPEGRPTDATDLRRRIVSARSAPVSVSVPVPVFTPLLREPEVSAPAPRLPSWARGMTTGHKATAGSLALAARGYDPAAGLTGEWTTGSGVVRAPEPTAAPSPTAGLPPEPTTAPTTGPTAEPTPGLPPELPAVLAARHRAGLGLGRLGRWDEAEAVHRSVVADRERVLGPDHPDTLTSRYEWGFALGRLDRPTDALREFHRVTEARERMLGADHPDTLAARQETAYLLGRLGRHFEAHDVYAEVLVSRERTMGQDHPDTLRCRHNLAFNLGRLGRLEESYRMAREVAEARGRLLGADHPDTLVTRYEVAYTLGRLGRWKEALDGYREVAATRAAVLGADHPDTLATRYEVGICLGRLGLGAEALALYRELTEARGRVHGPDHPETLRARHGVGVNLGRLSRWEEAVAEARAVCAVRERVLGPDHPDTLISRREVAVGLGWLARWDEALTAYHEVAEARARTLGPDHPDTLTAREDEAHCLEQLGRPTEAAELHRGTPSPRQGNGGQRAAP